MDRNAQIEAWKHLFHHIYKCREQLEMGIFSEFGSRRSHQILNPSHHKAPLALSGQSHSSWSNNTAPSTNNTLVLMRPSVRQERLNTDIAGLGWSVIGEPGLHWLGRSNSCTEENRVNSGKRKLLTAEAIQRSYIWRHLKFVLFDRSKKSFQILWTLSWRNWQACVHRLRRLFPRSSTKCHASPVSSHSKSLIPSWYDEAMPHW